MSYAWRGQLQLVNCSIITLQHAWILIESIIIYSLLKDLIAMKIFPIGLEMITVINHQCIRMNMQDNEQDRSISTTGTQNLQ